MQAGGRAGLRVFTGTIPDYATEVKGLLLLELLKIGQPTTVVFLRNGERRETTLTPAARK
jgi:hypothetical protein